MNLQKKVLSNKEKSEIKLFLLGAPVIQVKQGAIIADKYGTAIQNARKWANLNKEIIFRHDIGNIIFDERGVKDSLAHGFSQRKLDAVQAIPETIKSGKIVEVTPDNTGKPQINVIIMAPIQIGENRSILAVRLRKNPGDEHRFYIHEIVDLPEDNKKGNTIRPLAHDLTVNPQGGTALYINILQNILDVKEMGNELPLPGQNNE